MDKHINQEIQSNLINNLYQKASYHDNNTAVRQLYIDRVIDAIYGLEKTG